MKPRYLLFPLLLSYLIALIGLMPARFVIEWLPLPAGVGLGGVSGTLWRGQAQTLRWDNQQIGPFSWTWRGLALLEGSIAAQICLADPRGIQGAGTIGWNGEWNIDDATLKLPAAVLQNALPLTLQLAGEIDARLVHLRFTPNHCLESQAFLRWKNGGVTDNAQALNTGDVRLRLRCVSTRWLADITQSSPEFNSTGQLSLKGFKAYRLQGEITPGPTFPPALLMLMTQSKGSDAPGRYTFDTSGRW
ncbi:type II secretion system protein N [Buttiauxella gaviniae]|uniref:Type II secretion system protein N n=1 Tax=Buttiauxella gaviniae TaxID=82990 RepID=A0ABV3NZZ1_9ENTR